MFDWVLHAHLCYEYLNNYFHQIDLVVVKVTSCQINPIQKSDNVMLALNCLACKLMIR